MRSLSAVAVLSGPLVLTGYIAGSATVTRLRRDGAEPRPSDHLIESVVTLVAANVAWRVIEEVAPGSGFSRIGYFSNQVLAAWHSVALWTGLAVVAGCCAPVFRRFRGSNGLAGAAALLAVHYPWLLFATAGAGTITAATTRSFRAAHFAAIAVLLPTTWLGWVLEWMPAWGLPIGPEATVWSMVATVVLGVRWWSTPAPGPAA